MFDLNNLQEEYKTGARVESPESESILLMTPVGRLSFPQLVEAKPFQNDPKSVPRFGATIVFETEQGKPGAVDLNAVFFPAFLEASERLKASARQTSEGIYFGGDRNCLIRFGERLNQSSGQPYDGYRPTSVAITSYRYPSPQSPNVPCRGPDGQPINPSAALAGYWVRFVINPYRPKNRPTPMISSGLVSVQIVAEGETFGQNADYVFGAVPGAPSLGPASNAQQDMATQQGAENTVQTTVQHIAPTPSQTAVPQNPMNFDFSRFQK